jgi:adenylate cyclase
MLESTIEWLVNNEPVISAFVGLVTLTAACWAILQFIVFRNRHMASRSADSQNQEDALAQLEHPSIWTSLVDMGLPEHSVLEDIVSIRTVNICLFVILMVNLTWVVVSLFSRDTLILTIINGTTFVVALFVYALQHSGKTNLARWALLSMTLFYWGFILVLVGPMRTVEYFLPLILMLPILLFSKNEKRQIFSAITLVLSTFCISIYLQGVIPSMAVLDNLPDLMESAYYVNLGLSAIAIFLVLNFYNNAAAENFHELEFEKSKTDKLMKSILPDYIANRISDQGSVVADWHQEATVLILTIGGFDTLSQRVSAVHLVEILSEIFVKFDALAKEQGVEKVNTLDTTYVIATGISKDTEADHTAVASFALQALEVVKEFSLAVSHPLTFCAGISTGQVVSGVIGDARPCFDIWGDTVELAYSMRTSAVDNSIVVNEPAYWRLQKAFEFAAIEGPQDTHLLLREK